MAREYPSGRRIAPSILSADFGRLGDQVKTVMDAGARVIHVDVMDGHFVPPITIGPLIVDGIRELVHDAGRLHRRAPDDRAPRAPRRRRSPRRAPTRSRSTSRPRRTCTTPSRRSTSSACKAGRRAQPGAPRPRRSSRSPDVVDLVLCMTVNPGWGGQSYIAGSDNKVAQLKRLFPQAADRGRRRDRHEHRARSRSRGRAAVRRRLGGLRRARPGRCVSRHRRVDRRRLNRARSGKIPLEGSDDKGSQSNGRSG